MTTAIDLRAAVGAREALTARTVLTPARPMKLTRADGTVEILRPGRDLVIPGHEFTRHGVWRAIAHPCSPRGRAERIRRLEAELADIQRQKRAMTTARAGTPRPSCSPRTNRRASPWHLPEPRTGTAGRL